jgi:uncharacterized protein (UPF0297 family)
VCETLFFPLRSDAIYCSARCRKRAQRAKTNKSKDATQSLYKSTLSNVYTLLGTEGYNQLRTIALAILNGLPDEHREKLYSAIEDDFYRIRDATRHG